MSVCVLALPDGRASDTCSTAGDTDNTLKNEASAILLFRLRGVKRIRKIKPIDAQTTREFSSNRIGIVLKERCATTDEHG